MDSDTIIAAVNGVTKKWTKQRKAEERQHSAARNRRHALASRRRITVKEACYRYLEAAYLKASANQTFPATARQVMYAIRPSVQELTGQRLSDSYFTQTLLPDYMKEYGKEEVWDVVYDDRGHFQEPHSGQAIGLGTLGVRRYLGEAGDATISPTEVEFPQVTTHGPKHRFGAVLFIEKEGFMPLFERVRLAERYDLAIMSTKGVSNTASRRLIDALGAQCDLPILVLHDFDVAGFLILAALQRDTRRYSFHGGQLNVIDLGLRLDDVLEYNLDYEDAYENKNLATQRRNLRSNGATPEEIEVLLQRRVELNAFSSDQLVEWIEAKLDDVGVSKVVPDEEYLAQVYRRFLATKYLREQIKEIQERAEEQAKDAVVPSNLGTRIKQQFNQDDAVSWDQVIRSLVQEEQTGS